MLARNFRAWQKHMGWSNSEIARRLQIARGTVIKYRLEGAPLHIALAAVALAAGLEPWTRG
jgi:transcriptional regulator with XRE-family HTH domain